MDVKKQSFSIFWLVCFSKSSHGLYTTPAGWCCDISLIVISKSLLFCFQLNQFACQTSITIRVVGARVQDKFEWSLGGSPRLSASQPDWDFEICWVVSRETRVRERERVTSWYLILAPFIQTVLWLDFVSKWSFCDWYKKDRENL